MPRYTTQQRTSFSIDGPNVVAWLILAVGLTGSAAHVALTGWDTLPLAGGVALGSLAWWALLRVLVQVRKELKTTKRGTDF